MSQLTILQEVLTLAVFVPFAVFLYEATNQAGSALGRPVFLGAVYFVFRR